jgi:broad specificity phosphatase PhoE
LNEIGQAQAQAFFESYQHVPFDKIYTSKLKRTTQSVQDFIALGIPTERHEGLNEISWGINEGKIPKSGDDDFYKNLIENWQIGNTDFPAEGGESPEDVAKRQQKVIDLILSRQDETLILIAMHGRAIRILLTKLLKKPLSDMDFYEHSNLCLYKLEYDYASQTFSLEIENDITHLLLLEVA